MIKAVKKHPFVSVFLLLAFLFLVVFIYAVRTISNGGVSISLGDKIALLEINGVIFDSKDALDQIKVITENENLKGVVVRINSPGGGVAPSQEIYEELRKLADQKPVVASLSSVAASGGYYIASAANKIVANPGTLTGSIGVIMDFSNLEGLFEKVGIKSTVVKSGKYKDIGSPHREMTVDEKKLLHDVIDNVHSQFVSAIVAGRNMDRSEIEKIADGRIFSGEQAFSHGLVDKLGTIQDSIALAAEMSGIKGEPKVYYMKKEKGLLDYLINNRYAGAVFDSLSMPQFMYLATF